MTLVGILPAKKSLTQTCVSTHMKSREHDAKVNFIKINLQGGGELQ